jgi:hypothetical protein
LDFHRFLENLPQDVKELREPAGPELVHACQRMNASLKKGFVGVEVSDTSKNALVQKQRLDRSATTRDGGRELWRIDFRGERVGPQAALLQELVGRRDDFDSTELASIFECQVSAVPEIEDHARKTGRCRRVLKVREIPRHSEMKADEPTSGQCSEKVFSVALNRLESPSRRSPTE